MRVITGTARGRKLKTPENYDIRPTTDNVKESVFNIIQFFVVFSGCSLNLGTCSLPHPCPQQWTVLIVLSEELFI